MTTTQRPPDFAARTAEDLPAAPTDGPAELREDAAARGAVLTFVGTVTGAAANFAMLAVVARVYGAEAFGVFSGIVALFLVLTMVTRLGADMGTTWFVTRLVTNRARTRVPALLQVALTPVAAVSVLVGLVLALASSPLAGLLSDDANRADFAAMLRIVAFAVPVATVGEILLGATRGFGAMRPTVIASQFGRQVGQLVTVAAAAVFTNDLRVLALAWVLPYLGTVVYPMWWLRAATAGTPAAGGPLWRPFWRYAGPQAANQSAQIGLEKFDIILLGPIAGVAAQGGYNAANRLAHLVVLAWYAINLAHGPVWGRLFEQRRTDEVARSAQMVSTWGMLFVAPLLWTFVVFGSTWTGLVGEGLSIGGPALTVLAVGLLVALTLGPCENLLLMAGQSGRSFVNNLVALGVNVGLNLVLIRLFGAVGAAIAWAIALLVVRGLASAHLRRAYGIVSWSAPLAEAWVLGAVAAGGAALLSRLVLGEGLVALVVAAVVGWPIVAGVAWTRRERFGLGNLVGSVLRRGGDGPQDHAAGEAREPNARNGHDPVSAGAALVADEVTRRFDVDDRTDPIEALVPPSSVLELRVRSRAAIASPCTPAQLRLLLAVVPAAGWRGRLVLGAVARLAPQLGERAHLLPLLRRRPLDVSFDHAVIRDALRRSASKLDRRVDGLLWLLPPAGDTGRLGVLLLDGDEPVGHLRMQLDTSWQPRPRASGPEGLRSGVRWPMVLDRWFLGGVRCELSTALPVRPHHPAVLDLDELLAVVDDIADALTSSAAPPSPGLHAVHGDLTPWNLRRTDDGRLVLYDWEHATHAPAAADLVRFLVTSNLPDEVLAKVPSERLGACVEAVEHWRQIEQERARSERRLRWKRRSRNRTEERLQLLAELASGAVSPRAARARRSAAHGGQPVRLLPSVQRHLRAVVGCAVVGGVLVGAASLPSSRTHVASADVVLRDPFGIDPTLITFPVGGDFERFVRQQAFFASSAPVVVEAATRLGVDPADLATRVQVRPDDGRIVLTFTARAGSPGEASAALDAMIGAYGQQRRAALGTAVIQRLAAIDAELADRAPAGLASPDERAAAARQAELLAEAGDLRLGVDRYADGITVVERDEVEPGRTLASVAGRTILGVFAGLTTGMAAAWIWSGLRRRRS